MTKSKTHPARNQKQNFGIPPQRMGEPWSGAVEEGSAGAPQRATMHENNLHTTRKTKFLARSPRGQHPPTWPEDYHRTSRVWRHRTSYSTPASGQEKEARTARAGQSTTEGGCNPRRLACQLLSCRDN